VLPGPGYASFGAEEERNVLEVLETWKLTRSSYGDPNADRQVRCFEREVGEAFGSRYCVPVNSGTSALLAGLAALGIGPGDEVIVPGYMFVASIGSVVFSGATPVLAEIDESLTLDPEDVIAKITPRTRAIMGIHMLGAPCDMTALRDIARGHGVYLIEDVAQACGGSYQGRLLGTLGDVGAFSLNIYKVITGGEGGFLLTNDQRTFQHGHSFHDQGWFPYRQETGDGDLMFGLNLRMTEFTAAVARAQLGKLKDILASTRAVKEQLASLIPDGPGFRRRVLHDPAGDCATVLVYVFDRASDAAAVAASLGIRTLLESPKHYYGGIPALPALTDVENRPCPFRAPIPASQRKSLLPGALPRSDDILSRSVALSVGLSDSYLGPGFGVHVHSTPEQIASAADKFRTAIDHVLNHQASPESTRCSLL
jgi:dTDP-4-amino-4,6-dideoxygalactose transaminase